MDEQTREEAVSLKIKLLREKSKSIEQRHKLVEEDKRRAEQRGNAVNCKQAPGRPSKNFRSHAHMDEPFEDAYQDAPYNSEQKDYRRKSRDTREYYGDLGQGDGPSRKSYDGRHQGSRRGGPVRGHGDYQQQQFSTQETEYQDDYDNSRGRQSRYRGHAPNRSKESVPYHYQQQQRGNHYNEGKRQGDRKAAEREQQRLNNVKLMDAQLFGKIQKGDKEWQEPQGYLQDSQREGEGEFSKRPPPRNVRYNPNDSRNRPPNRNQGGNSKMDRMMDMTGRQRRDYDRWKQQQEEADKERLARSQGDGGRWRRDWDNDKKLDFDDDVRHDRRDRRDFGRGASDRGGNRRDYTRRSEQQHTREHDQHRNDVYASRRSRDYDGQEGDEFDREQHPRSDIRRVVSRDEADDPHGNDARRSGSRDDWDNGDNGGGYRDKRSADRFRDARNRDVAARNDSARRSNSNDWGQEADVNLSDGRVRGQEHQASRWTSRDQDHENEESAWGQETNQRPHQTKNDAKWGREQRSERPYQNRGQGQRNRSYNNRRDDRPRRSPNQNDEPRDQRPRGGRYQSRPDASKNRDFYETQNQNDAAKDGFSGDNSFSAIAGLDAEEDWGSQAVPPGDSYLGANEENSAKDNASVSRDSRLPTDLTGSSPDAAPTNAESHDATAIDQSRDNETSDSDQAKPIRNKGNLKVQIGSKAEKSIAPQDVDPQSATKRSSLTSPLKTPENFVPVGDWALEVEMSSPTYEPGKRNSLDPIAEGSDARAIPDASHGPEEVYDADKSGESAAIDDSAPLLTSEHDEEADIDKERMYCQHDDRSSGRSSDNDDDDDNDNAVETVDDNSNQNKTDDDDGDDDSFSTSESGQNKESVEYQRLVEENDSESGLSLHDEIQDAADPDKLDNPNNESSPLPLKDPEPSDDFSPESSQPSENRPSEVLQSDDNAPKESQPNDNLHHVSSPDDCAIEAQRDADGRLIDNDLPEAEQAENDPTSQKTDEKSSAVKEDLGEEEEDDAKWSDALESQKNEHKDVGESNQANNTSATESPSDGASDIKDAPVQSDETSQEKIEDPHVESYGDLDQDDNEVVSSTDSTVNKQEPAINDQEPSELEAGSNGENFVEPRDLPPVISQEETFDQVSETVSVGDEAQSKS